MWRPFGFMHDLTSLCYIRPACRLQGWQRHNLINTRRQRALRARGWHYDGCRRILRSSESATQSGALTVHKKDDTDCKSAPAGELFGTLNLSESATLSGALTALQQMQQPTKVPLKVAPSLHPGWTFTQSIKYDQKVLFTLNKNRLF